MNQKDPLVPTGVGVLIQNRFMLVRDTLRLVIERLYGASVVASVSTPSEALEAARISLPDIAVIDLEDQEAALRAVRLMTEEHLATKVICIADEPTQDLIEAAVRAGATGIALKSDTVADIERAFGALESGATTIAPNAAGPLVRHYLEIMEHKRRRDGEVIEALASAIDAKDHFTGGHTRRVAALASEITARIDSTLGTNEQLRFGFVLHDVGKIGIPEGILMKPGALSQEEWQVMRTHPIIGVQIVEPLALGSDADSVIRHHHEGWTGAGYPDKLSGKEIPLGARIFAVADTYDAMTNDRPYRDKVPKSVAVGEITDRAGDQFDPMAVEALLDVVVAAA